MRTPELALAWQTWARHRWGLAIVVLGLLADCWLQRALPRIFWMSDTAAVLTSVTLGFMFFYLFYVFSYAELGPRPKASSFPSWMFTLPVRTAKLVIFPMVLGGLAIGLAWVVSARYVLQPAGLEVPIWWPALGLAGTLAGLQAIDWSPLGFFVKVVAAGLALAGLWTGLMWPSATWIQVVVLAVFLPAAYATAVWGVGRARQGNGEAWGLWHKPIEHILDRLPRAGRPFSSPARALLWWEWKRNGIVLLILSGCWLAFLSLLIPFSGRETITTTLIFSTTWFFPLAAPLLGAVLGKVEVRTRQFRLSSFAAARPVTSGALVAAKLKATAIGLASSWLMCLAATLLWLDLAEQLSLREIEGSWERMRMLYDPSFIYWVIALSVIGLVGFTYLQLAGHLFAGLAGSVWLFAAIFVFYLVVVPDLLAFQSSILNQQTLADALPLLAGILVGLKLAAAVALFLLARTKGLISPRAAVLFLTFWLLIALDLFYLVKIHFQLDDIKSNVRLEHIAAGVILALPLNRVILAPLALDWNRRR